MGNDPVTIEKNSRSGYGMVLMAGVLWGFIGLFVTLLMDAGASAKVIPVLRTGAGAILMVPVILLASGPKAFRIDLKGVIYCAVLGVMCQGLFNLAYTQSIKFLGVSTAVMLLYTAPVFVCILSRIFFKEKIGVNKIAAILLNIFGCLLTITGGDVSSFRFNFVGVLAGVCAGFLYSLTTIIGKVASGKYDPLAVVFYSFVAGTIFMVFIAKPWEYADTLLTGRIIVLSLLYGLVSTVGSYFFYFKGLSKAKEASKVPVFASIETIVAAFIGIVYFHEAQGPVGFTGMALVVLSILIMNLWKPKGEKRA
ncbi:MAG: EamA family transporter [Firmicutes bacterium]|nr:EamA family transporter [Bacillota bacterium]